MKKYIAIVMILCFSLISCGNNDVAVNNTEQEMTQSKAAVENTVSETSDEVQENEVEGDALEQLLGIDTSQLSEVMLKEANVIASNILAMEKENKEDEKEKLDGLYAELETLLYGDMSSDLEPWTLESYLMTDYSLLNQEQLDEVQVYLDKINALEQAYSEDKADEIEKLYIELEDLLSDFGLSMASMSYEDFVNKYPDAFTEAQKTELLKVADEITQLNESDPESEKLDELYETLEMLLTDAGFDPRDVISEIEMGSTIYAKYKVDGALVDIVDDADADTKKKYQHIVDQARKVISNDMTKYINYIIINTDGPDNVLGYMENENEELTKWRMVLDVKDAYDENGDYRSDYDETIVHEFAHLLTLNAGQMQDKSTGTYENQEGITKENSYLNLFYQKFWPEIYDDFEKIVDPYDQTGDSAYQFYEKYEDQFVSDYAATNPEEDFAETFRIFVFSDKPESSAIKDQKVRYLYEFDELVKLRDMIRTNLKIN